MGAINSCQACRPFCYTRSEGYFYDLIWKRTGLKDMTLPKFSNVLNVSFFVVATFGFRFVTHVVYFYLKNDIFYEKK